jgi:hypothetical protein
MCPLLPILISYFRESVHSPPRKKPAAQATSKTSASRPDATEPSNPSVPGGYPSHNAQQRARQPSNPVPTRQPAPIVISDDSDSDSAPTFPVPKPFDHRAGASKPSKPASQPAAPRAPAFPVAKPYKPPSAPSHPEARPAFPIIAPKTGAVYNPPPRSNPSGAKDKNGDEFFADPEGATSGYEAPRSAAEVEKDLRDLLSGSLQEDQAVDMSEAIVEGLADGVELKAHQVISRKWMREREEGNKRGGILADDMGYVQYIFSHNNSGH